MQFLCSIFLILFFITTPVQAQSLQEVIERAEKILEQGNPDKALNELKPYYKTLQSSERGYLLIGRILVEKGEMQAASKVFSSVHQSYPNNAIALQWWAYSLAELGEYEESNKTIVKLMQLQGQSVYAHSSVCVNFYKSKQFQKAIDACSTAINMARQQQEAALAYAYKSMAMTQLAKQDNRLTQALPAIKRDCQNAGSQQGLCQSVLDAAMRALQDSKNPTAKDSSRSDNPLEAFADYMDIDFTKTIFDFSVIIVVALTFFVIAFLLLLPILAMYAEQKKLPLVDALHYVGRKSTLLSIWLKNLFLTIVTLGIYRFWGITAIRRYLWSHTSLQGKPLEYHGTGKEIFKGFLKILVFLIVFTLIPEISRFLVNDTKTAIVVSALLYVIYLFFFYIIMYAALRYRLSRTTWQSIRFRLNGKARTYGVRRFTAFWGKILSLGILTPRLDLWCYRYIAETLQYGNIQARMLDYDPQQYKKLKRSNMLTYLMAIPTIGFSRMWYKAALTRFRLNHTAFDHVRLQGNHTGSSLAWLSISNLLLVVLTLGFGVPIAIHRNVKYHTSHIGVDGDLDSLMVEQIKAKGGAAAEGFEDGFGDADIGGFI